MLKENNKKKQVEKFIKKNKAKTKKKITQKERELYT